MNLTPLFYLFREAINRNYFTRFIAYFGHKKRICQQILKLIHGVYFVVYLAATSVFSFATMSKVISNSS
jgi:hypothetical protein